jgi:hypothetical protein
MICDVCRTEAAVQVYGVDDFGHFLGGKDTSDTSRDRGPALCEACYASNKDDIWLCHCDDCAGFYHDKTSSGNSPVVCTYRATVSIGGPADPIPAMHDINKAFGFDDGNCNRIDKKTGEIVGKLSLKQEEFTGLQKVHHALRCSYRVNIEVTLHKNGEKTFKLLTED